MTTVGVTPRDLIEQRGTMALYHYRAVETEVYRVPLLIVMPPTNRGYILDLASGRSLVEFLLRRGYDVYMLDWNAPREGDRDAGIDAYVAGFVARAAARVAEDSGEPDVTLVGYCMGGVLAGLYAARFPGVANLVALTTPVDFAAFELWQRWTDRRWFDPASLTGSDGIVASHWIYAGFDQLRPTSRLAGAVKLWDRHADADYLTLYRQLDRWSADVLPLTGAFFRDTIERLMWDNTLIGGGVDIAGRAVRLGEVTAPFLHVVAGADHIVPYAASHPLVGLVGSDGAEEVVVPGGHVMLLAGNEARTTVWPLLDRWLEGRSL